MLIRMLPAPPERRRSLRLQSIEQHGIVASRLHPGAPAVVLDISDGGALVETECRLLAGAPVLLQMKTRDQTAVVRGRVLRSALAQPGPRPVRYRGAIGFDDDIAWNREKTRPGVLSSQT